MKIEVKFAEKDCKFPVNFSDNGYEAGVKSEYDKFWDAFQNNGNRTVYDYAFRGYGWTADNFYPKYDIRPVGNNTRMFYNWGQNGSDYFNLKKRLEDCGVVLDTSKATYLTFMFSYGHFGTIPTIDLSSCANGRDSTVGIFRDNYYYLTTIEKIIIHEGITPSSWFTNTTGLKNLTLEGTLGKNGFDVSSCTALTHDSLMSITNCLKDYSADTSGTTYTVTLGATNLAKLTDAEKATATQKGWTLA